MHVRDDHLALEEPIVTRLREEIEELKTVTTAAELEDVANMRQRPTPAAIVIYDGDDVLQQPDATVGRGAHDVVLQRWLVVLAIQNVRDQRHGSAMRRDGGPLIRRVMDALRGWQPPVGGVRPLVRVSAPGPAFEAGYGYFPIMFHARCIS